MRWSAEFFLVRYTLHVYLFQLRKQESTKCRHDVTKEIYSEIRKCFEGKSGWLHKRYYNGSHTMEIPKEGSIGIKSRTVLWYLTFSGFAINYIIRVNVPIAIVDMIDANYKKTASNRTVVTSECIAAINMTSTELVNELNLVEESKYVSMERRLLDFLGVRQATNFFNVKVIITW